jgi:DNA-binding response OmpR family regulator
MNAHQLAGARVLIVEDEYYLADEARSILANIGADVLGPVATVLAARELINSSPEIDGVLLDLNLRGEMAFDIADTLQERGIPFAFVTGYDRAMLPDRFADAVSLEKPVRSEQLIAVFGSLASSRRSPVER